MLFAQHVTADESSFAETLYLTLEQACEMEQAGMEFGGHGNRHLWHNRCSTNDLTAEIEGSLAVLNAIGRPAEHAFYCYPFGGVDEAVVSAARDAGFVAGFTVEPRVADLSRDAPMLLPRLDTNNLPFSAEASR